MSNESSWRRVGWRSIRHRIAPDMVVRFGAKGAKVKYLAHPLSTDDPRHAMLINEAVEFWKGQV